MRRAPQDGTTDEGSVSSSESESESCSFANDIKAKSYAWAAATNMERAALSKLLEQIEEKEGLMESLKPLASSYGSLDRLLLCYLRAGDVSHDPARAIARLKTTLSWRRLNGIDKILDAAAALKADPLNSVWPFALPAFTTDGCPVQIANVGAVKPSQITKGPDGEDGLRRALTLNWLRALEMASQTEETRHCRGNYDIYDCRALSWSQCDVSSLRVLARCVTLGNEFFPEYLHKCYFINAPRVRDQHRPCAYPLAVKTLARRRAPSSSPSHSYARLACCPKPLPSVCFAALEQRAPSHAARTDARQDHD